MLGEKENCLTCSKEKLTKHHWSRFFRTRWSCGRHGYLCSFLKYTAKISLETCKLTTSKKIKISILTEDIFTQNFEIKMGLSSSIVQDNQCWMLQRHPEENLLPAITENWPEKSHFASRPQAKAGDTCPRISLCIWYCKTGESSWSCSQQFLVVWHTDTWYSCEF